MAWTPSADTPGSRGRESRAVRMSGTRGPGRCAGAVNEQVSTPATCLSPCGVPGAAFLGLALLAAASFLTVAESGAATVNRYVIDNGTSRLEVTAPREDIIRVRVGHPELPEDASWAVRAAVRGVTSPMEATESAGAVLLRTGATEVSVERQTLRVVVRDTAGRVVLQDAGAGATFDGAGFTVRKLIPEDTHFFGLGDKRDRSTGAGRRSRSGVPMPTASPPPPTRCTRPSRSFSRFAATGGATASCSTTPGEAISISASVTREPSPSVPPVGPSTTTSSRAPGRPCSFKQYAWITGTSPLTPLWALGLQQSHFSYPTQGAVEAEANRLRADRVPADALYLDIDFQDRHRPFTIDSATFPNLGRLVAKLKADKLHLVLITDLHIALAPHEGYAPYDSGKAAGGVRPEP